MAVRHVFVNVKSIGKRKPALRAMPYVLPDDVTTLRDLLISVVKSEVDSYNAKESDNAKESEAMLLPFLTQEQIGDQSVSGKVSFGRIYSDKKADPGKAVDMALQGFEDGLFRVMIRDTEAETLDGPIVIEDGDTLTFIRLTFLTGRLW